MRPLLLLSLLAVSVAPLWAQPAVTTYERFDPLDTPRGFDPALAPFFHGVASGDPLSDRVILWTRVTPDSEGPVRVRWGVATDPEGQNLVRTGQVTTDASRDYTVKIDATGLQPDRTYYYGFQALGRRSPVGRTRTAPAGSADHLRFAVVSCSNYQNGFYNAYARIAERDDLAAVIHLGDYIYEYEDGGFGFDPEIGRGHEPEQETVSLDDYRVRYSFYRLDADLQRVHQQHPFITVWDDHEFANDAWTGGAQNHQPGTEGPWQARKQNAFKAYAEWMPVRMQAPEQIYRKIAYGDLLDFFMLDTRVDGREEQEPGLIGLERAWVRTDYLRQRLGQAEAPGTTGADLRAYLDRRAGADSVNVHDLLASVFGENYTRWAQPAPAVSEERGGPDYRRLISEAQYQWLTDGLSASTARWKVLGNQVQMHPIVGYTNPDAWDGYPEERDRLLNFILDHDIRNVAAVTGDIHSTWVADVPENLTLYTLFFGATSTLGEFVTPSVTSSNLDEILPFGAELIEFIVFLLNPHIKDVEVTKNGYMLLDATEDRLQADWYYVDTVRRPDDGETFGQGYFLPDGQRQVRQASGPAARATSPAPAPFASSFAPLGSDTAEAAATSDRPLLVIGNYPNPVQDRTRIHYALADEQPVRITVYDALGRRVQTLVDEVQPAGAYGVVLDAAGLASGTYLYRVEAGPQTVTRSLVLSR